jgi:hypothetical protein
MTMGMAQLSGLVRPRTLILLLPTTSSGTSTPKTALLSAIYFKLSCLCSAAESTLK